MGTIRPRLAASTLALALVTGACSSGGHHDAQAAGAGRTTTTEAPGSTTTEAPTTTTSTTSTTVPVDGLAPGMSGDRVRQLQEQLAAQRYDVGTADGQYGGQTAQAVMAFQKVHGMERTGRATEAVLAKLATVGTPHSLLPGAEPTRVEFDKNRQVLFVIIGGELRAVVNASSGSGRPYCENGYCGDARTPDGAFRITRRIKGWRVSPLGRLWNPLYFNGGIAIHGSHSVPGYPASHGCVRVSMSAATWIYDAIPNGTPVYVIGSRTPTPFNQRGQATPTTDNPELTSTTAAPTTTAPTTTTTEASASTTTTTTVAPTSTSSPAP